MLLKKYIFQEVTATESAVAQPKFVSTIAYQVTRLSDFKFVVV